MKSSQIHPEIQESMDLQIDCDRDWFKQHPFAQRYYRKPFDNEIAQGLQLYGKHPKKMKISKVTGELRIKNYIF